MKHYGFSWKIDLFSDTKLIFSAVGKWRSAMGGKEEPTEEEREEKRQRRKNQNEKSEKKQTSTSSKPKSCKALLVSAENVPKRPRTIIYVSCLHLSITVTCEIHIFCLSSAPSTFQTLCMHPLVVDYFFTIFFLSCP